MEALGTLVNRLHTVSSSDLLSRIGEPLLMGLCHTFSDNQAIPLALQCILHTIEGSPEMIPAPCVLRLASSITKSHFHRMPLAPRQVGFRILEILLASPNCLKALEPKAAEFILWFVGCVDSEKDPRLLLSILKLHRCITKYAPFEQAVASKAEDLFRTLAPIFPIDFHPPPNAPGRITKPQLEDALRESLLGTPHFHAQVARLALDKTCICFSSTKVSAFDLLNHLLDGEVLDFNLLLELLPDLKKALLREIPKTINDRVLELALTCLHRVTARLADYCLPEMPSLESMQHDLDEICDPLQSFVTDILEHCQSGLTDPREAQPCRLILQRVAGASAALCPHVILSVMPAILEALTTCPAISRPVGPSYQGLGAAALDAKGDAPLEHIKQSDQVEIDQDLEAELGDRQPLLHLVSALLEAMGSLNLRLPAVLSGFPLRSTLHEVLSMCTAPDLSPITRSLAITAMARAVLQTTPPQATPQDASQTLTPFFIRHAGLLIDTDRSTSVRNASASAILLLVSNATKVCSTESPFPVSAWWTEHFGADVPSLVKQHIIAPLAAAFNAPTNDPKTSECDFVRNVLVRIAEFPPFAADVAEASQQPLLKLLRGEATHAVEDYPAVTMARCLGKALGTLLSHANQAGAPGTQNELIERYASPCWTTLTHSLSSPSSSTTAHNPTAADLWAPFGSAEPWVALADLFVTPLKSGHTPSVQSFFSLYPSLFTSPPSPSSSSFSSPLPLFSLSTSSPTAVAGVPLTPDSLTLASLRWLHFGSLLLSQALSPHAKIGVTEIFEHGPRYLLPLASCLGLLSSPKAAWVDASVKGDAMASDATAVAVGRALGVTTWKLAACGPPPPWFPLSHDLLPTLRGLVSDAQPASPGAQSAALFALGWITKALCFSSNPRLERTGCVLARMIATLLLPPKETAQPLPAELRASVLDVLDLLLSPSTHMLQQRVSRRQPPFFSAEEETRFFLLLSRAIFPLLMSGVETCWNALSQDSESEQNKDLLASHLALLFRAIAKLSTWSAPGANEDKEEESPFEAAETSLNEPSPKGDDSNPPLLDLVPPRLLSKLLPYLRALLITPTGTHTSTPRPALLLGALQSLEAIILPPSLAPLLVAMFTARIVSPSYPPLGLPQKYQRFPARTAAAAEEGAEGDAESSDMEEDEEEAWSADFNLDGEINSTQDSTPKISRTVTGLTPENAHQRHRARNYLTANCEAIIGALLRIATQPQLPSQESHTHMHTRDVLETQRRALDCLACFPVALPAETVSPYRVSVDRALGVDALVLHPKRLIRQAAMRCRGRWALLAQPASA